MFSGQPRILATYRELTIYLKIFTKNIYNFTILQKILQYYKKNLRFVSPNWDLVLHFSENRLRNKLLAIYSYVKLILQQKIGETSGLNIM